MAKLSRRWIRIVIRLVIFAVLLTSVVVFADSYYYNFLPTSVHNKLPLHLPGTVITDIKVKSCITRTGCLSEDTDEGWERIPKDLYLGKRWSKRTYIYVKREKEEDLKNKKGDDDKVVIDVAVDPADVEIQDSSWKQAGPLWVKYGKSSTDSKITALDVLFGPDCVDPRPGWKLKNGYIDSISSPIGPRLSIRVGREIVVPKPKLRVPKSGRFKILQIADLHFSTGVGKCEDPLPEYENGCKADPRTLDFVTRLLDHENPDFVVLTGDQIYGLAAPDSETAMLKVVAPLIERKIPYAMIFGNHDDEGSMNRLELTEMVQDFPYCLTERGPKDIDGFGNFALQVQGPKSENPAMTFYFVDTHKHSMNPKKLPGYDFIKQNQIDWATEEYKRLKPLQDKYSHIHLSMAFVHIPLPEYYRAGNMFIGSFGEGSTAPKINSGYRDALVKMGVSVVNAGHDHVNDFCMFDDHTKEDKGSIWLCHGGAIGEGGYGGYGNYVRRARVLEVDTQSASISSWKIKHEEEYKTFDHQTLVKGGEPVPLT